jgi:PAS domain S-box-containing protein
VHQIELEMQNEEMRKAQNEIEAGMARYFDLYDMAPVGYVTVDGMGLTLEANLTAATMLGVNRDSLVRQPLTRFILREDQDVYYLLRKRLSETLSNGAGHAGVPRKCELRMVKPDGEVFWVRLDATATEGLEGTPAFRIVLSDITESKRVEEHVGSMVEMLDTAPTSITVHDFDGRFLYANRRTFEMHGYEASEFMALRLHELDVPDSADLIAGRMQLIREKGEATFEVSHLHKSGIQIQLEVFVKTVEWQGKPALLSIASDITERVQAEEAIRRAEKRSGALIENAPDGIVFVSIEGKFTYASPSTFKLFGYDTDEISQLAPDVLTHPDDLPRVLTVMSSVIQNPSLVTTLQYRFRHRDGRWLWIESTFSNLIAEPSIQAIVINFRDITDRRQAEEALRASQQLAESIIESIPGAFYMLDEAGNYVRWNAYQRDEIIGKPDDQIAGFPAIDTIHPDDRALVQARIEKVLQTGVDDTVEGRVLLRGGPKFQWLLMTGRQMVIEGHPHLVGIGIDITPRKQAEEDNRRQSEQLRLLHDASHRLNQTLDKDEIYQVLCEFMAANAPNDGFAISDFVSETNLITCCAYWMDNKWLDVSGFPPIPLEEEGKGTQSIVIRSGQPMLVPDFQALLRSTSTSYYVNAETNTVGTLLPDEEEDIIRSALIVPLKTGSRVSGVIQVMSYRLNAFTEDQLKLLEALSLHISSARQNALLYAQVQTELSERKRAEVELHESKQLLESVVENIPLTIFLKESQDLRFIMFNKAGEDLMGYHRRDLLGKNVLDLFPPGQAAHLNAQDREVLPVECCWTPQRNRS